MQATVALRFIAHFGFSDSDLKVSNGSAKKEEVKYEFSRQKSQDSEDLELTAKTPNGNGDDRSVYDLTCTI